MDVYKLRIEDTESKTIDKDRFESETFRREPWYQPGSAGKLAQFAVCPACDNPVQLVGLYELSNSERLLIHALAVELAGAAWQTIDRC